MRERVRDTAWSRMFAKEIDLGHLLGQLQGSIY